MIGACGQSGANPLWAESCLSPLDRGDWKAARSSIDSNDAHGFTRIIPADRFKDGARFCPRNLAFE